MPENVKLLAEGIGWQAECSAVEIGGAVIFEKAELNRFLEKISATHDSTGGGFYFSAVRTRESAPGCLLPNVGEEIDSGRVVAVYTDPNSGVGYVEVAKPFMA